MNYPLSEPHKSGVLSTGDGHQIYWEVCGNPDGKPAIVLHGGPGSGATSWWRQFFDPDRYRVVLFDQRGCGRSRPSAAEDLAALENNTTAHLVGDMETLREHLNIEQWLLFGASWGSTLGLSYAVEHPEHVSELVLWALVTTRARDVHWLTHVMGDVYPEEYDRLLSVLPAAERGGNVAAAIHALLRSDDPEVRDAAALAWCAWEDRLATLNGPITPMRTIQDPMARLGFSRVVTHYFGNNAFQADDAITSRLRRIEHIPAYFVRGRLDIASPLRSAYDITRNLPQATLDIVETDAHGAGEDTFKRLIETLNRLGAPANRGSTPSKAGTERHGHDGQR